MMSTLFTIPGQGVQKAGMLKALLQEKETQSILEQSSHHLGFDLLSIDNETALQSNKNTQIALTVCAVAYATLLIEREIVPDYILGLSIGAFGAAIIANSISLKDGLFLVAKRGELMSEAYPSGYGMAAIIGLPLSKIEYLLTQCQAENLPVYIANINTETQIIVSGSHIALKQICQIAQKHNAIRAQTLKVNVPSHCPLLSHQAEKLKPYFENITFHQPTITICSANMARVIHSLETIKNDLIYNMSRQVRWQETVAMLDERGVRLVIEMKPGDVLTHLCKVNMPHAKSMALSNEKISSISSVYHRNKQTTTQQVKAIMC